jgi:hypothetical protein
MGIASERNEGNRCSFKYFANETTVKTKRINVHLNIVKTNFANEIRKDVAKFRVDL